MSQKSNNEKKSAAKKKNNTWNGAMNFFIGGCLAELYLLLIRQKYVFGTLDEVLAWDAYLQYFLYAGLGILALGIVLALLFRKASGWKRSVGTVVLCAGAFLAVATLLIRKFYVTALTPLCFLVPAVMLLGILWVLYDRECSWALTILALDEVALWVCRKGLNTQVWKSKVIIGVIVAIVLAALAAVLFRKADQNGGKVGSLRLLPDDGDPLPVYVACGLTVVSLVLAVLSTTV
ncbi:MAG: hypothetical protein LKJ86_06010, partial [Oscillibacter sp.]|nr:hypothetical protein [Oscillibacter sp.]